MVFDTELRTFESEFFGPIPSAFCGVIKPTQDSVLSDPFVSAPQGTIYIWLPWDSANKERLFAPTATQANVEAELYIKVRWSSPPKADDWVMCSTQAIDAQ